MAKGKNIQKGKPEKKRKIYPGTDTTTPQTDDTSMSSGNLVNNPYGRTRSRTPHPKISITGSDDDGQAV